MILVDLTKPLRDQHEDSFALNELRGGATFAAELGAIFLAPDGSSVRAASDVVIFRHGGGTWLCLYLAAQMPGDLILKLTCALASQRVTFNFAAQPPCLMVPVAGVADACNSLDDARVVLASNT